MSSAFLRATGAALPSRVVGNEELAPLVGADAAWIEQVSGIRERRYAADSDTVVSLAVQAAEACLAQANVSAADLGMLLLSSGSPERTCPGPAGEVAARLGMTSAPALDFAIPSAGSLIALATAMRFTPHVGPVLVVASEIMSRRIDRTPEGKNTAILFGDGAGACLVDPSHGFLELADAALFTDGGGADVLYMDGDRLHMDGGSVILRASRKIPAALNDLLARNSLVPDDVESLVMHQANGNLIAKVAQGTRIAPERCFRNIDRYGNTSSASLLIALDEWHAAHPRPQGPVVLASFGAGLTWGAMLAKPA